MVPMALEFLAFSAYSPKHTSRAHPSILVPIYNDKTKSPPQLFACDVGNAGSFDHGDQAALHLGCSDGTGTHNTWLGLLDETES